MFIGHEKIYDVSFSNVSLWADMQDLCQIRVIEVFKHASWNYDYWHKYVLQSRFFSKKMYYFHKFTKIIINNSS